jgi:hypothetical protein
MTLPKALLFDAIALAMDLIFLGYRAQLRLSPIWSSGDLNRSLNAKGSCDSSAALRGEQPGTGGRGPKPPWAERERR